MTDQLEPLSFVNIPVWIYDVDRTRIVWANPRGLEYWGAASLQELSGRDMSKGMSVSVHKRLKQYLADCTKNRRSYNEHWTVYPNDEPQTAEIVFSPIVWTDGRPALLIHLLYENQDVDSGTLRSTQALLHTSAMISLYSDDLELLYSNPAARSVAVREGMRLSEQLADPGDIDTIRKKLDREGCCEMECRVKTVEGPVWHAMSMQVSPDPVSGGKSILVSATDITARRCAEEDALIQATIDSLTGLPNRAALQGKIRHQIKRAKNNGEKFALMFLGLDRFKLVNDSLGHSVGDELLQAFAKRLRHGVPGWDMIGRQGGDEFVVMLTDVEGRQMVAEIAWQLLLKMSDPVVVSGHKLRISPSMGVSFYPEDGKTSTTLLQHAEVAMYMAKASTDGFQFYEPAMGKAMRDRLELENDLANAIDEEQFELHYQPKIGTVTGEIVGVEALIRWDHPDRGLVNPSEFITIAEETGMIVPIGRWVVRQAIRDQNLWYKRGFDIPVSVNISPKQFLSADFADDIKQALTLSRCGRGFLELEITESVLIVDEAQVLKIMRILNQEGVGFSLDDFGTGYSNLAYLQKYPLDCLKIDQSFLRNIEETALLELILAIGRIMDLRVVAEGVETPAQIRWLRAHGCDELQGYYFSKPLSPHDWLDFMAEYRPDMPGIQKAA